MALIANMVGYNEADRYLPEVLEHLKGFADAIVFTDDCSTDNTKEIAAQYTDHVYQTPEQLFTKHEGQLRQFAWSNLEKHAHPGDWVLAIDCDEKLFVTNKSLDKLMHQGLYDVMAITFYHMWNEKQYRVDKGWVPTVSSRMFRFQPNGRYNQRKLACGSEPTYVVEAVRNRKMYMKSGLMMQHLGYVRDEDKQAKFERYSTLDGGNFHAINHINSIVDPEPTLVDWKY